MTEIKPSKIIFYIVFLTFFILLERIYDIWFDNEIWSIGLSVLTIFILLLFLNKIIGRYFEKLENKFDDEFDNIKWFNRLKSIFAIIGIVFSISFLSHKTSYRIILIHPEVKHFSIEINENWGLKKSIYELKFEESEWGYHSVEKGVSKWESLPIEVFDSEYLNTLSDYE